jgi:WD40 repeat protein
MRNIGSSVPLLGEHARNVSVADCVGMSISAGTFMMKDFLRPFVQCLVCMGLLAANVSSQELTAARLVAQVGNETSDAIAFSPDGRWLVTGGVDARIWDVGSGRELRRLIANESTDAIALLPDGRQILTSGRAQNQRDYIVRLWDSSTGTEVRRYAGHSGRIGTIAVSPDGRQMLTGSGDKTARLWDIVTGKTLRILRHSKAVTSVTFSSDGQLAFTGGWDVVRVWQLTSGRRLKEAGRKSYGKFLAISAHSQKAVNEGCNGEIWDITRDEPLVEIVRPMKYCFKVAAFSADGTRILLGTADGVVLLVNSETGAEIRRWTPRGSAADLNRNSVNAVVFSPDGRRVATLLWNQLQVWDSDSGEEIRRFEGRSGFPRVSTFFPDGRRLLIASDNSASVWDLETGRPIRRFDGHSVSIESASISTSGNLVVTGSYDGAARVWEADSGRQLHLLQGDTGSVAAVAISPDERFVLTGTHGDGPGQGTTTLWDLTTATEVQRFEAHGYVRSVAFSADMRFMASAGIDRVGAKSRWTARVWDFKSRKEVATLARGWITSVAFLPDGQHLVTGGEEGLDLWAVPTGRHIKHVSDAQAFRVHLAQEGRWVLTEDHGSSVARLWDLMTGREVRSFATGQNGMLGVDISRDGQWVVASDRNGSWLWSEDVQGPRVTLIAFYDGSWAVADPEGRYDATDPDRSEGLHWVVGDEVIELQQLKNRFYTPRLLGRVWQGERLPGVTGLRNVGMTPTITIIEPRLNDTLLELTLDNRGGGLGRVVVKVNGRELPDQYRPRDAQAASARVVVDLSSAVRRPDGENDLEVIAYDAKEVVATRPVRGGLKTTKQTDVKPDSFFALVVGTSRFSGPDSMNLKFAAKDATDMANALRVGATRLYGANRVHITVLTSDAGDESGRPTKSNIQRALNDISHDAQPLDTVVVYLAGHGLAYGPDTYYYLTQDARGIDLSDDGLREVSTLSSNELRRWLQVEVKALKQVIILDTCAAEAASLELVKLADKRELSPEQIRALELLKDSTGSFVLMGSAADKVSYEASRYGQGLLTYALLAGIKGEMPLEGQELRVLRWFAHAEDRVPALAREIGGIQRPRISAPRGNDFPIGLLTAGDRAGIPLASPKPQLLRILCFDENDADEIGLEPLLRARLRELSQPLARGANSADPKLVYLDNVVGDVADALMPRVRYQRTSGSLRATLRLVRGSSVIHQQDVTLPENASAASQVLAAEILAAIANLSVAD